MAVDWRALPRKTIRILLGSTLPALGLGYAILYVLYPPATFPAASLADFGWVSLVLIACALVSGFAATELTEAIAAGFVAVPMGFVVGVLLTLSPVFAGFTYLDPSSVPFFVGHFGILVLVLAFPVNFTGSLVGKGIRDWLLPPILPDRLARKEGPQGL